MDSHFGIHQGDLSPEVWSCVELQNIFASTCHLDHDDGDNGGDGGGVDDVDGGVGGGANVVMSIVTCDWTAANKMGKKIPLILVKISSPLFDHTVPLRFYQVSTRFH